MVFDRDMIKQVGWKNLICGLIFLIGLLPVQVTFRLLVVELIGGPLRGILGRFPGIFFQDKPYYTYMGGVIVMLIFSGIVYLIWTLVEKLATR